MEIFWIETIINTVTRSYDKLVNVFSPPRGIMSYYVDSNEFMNVLGTAAAGRFKYFQFSSHNLELVEPWKCTFSTLTNSIETYLHTFLIIFTIR